MTGNKRMTMLGLLLASSLLAADAQPAAGPMAGAREGDIKAVVETIQSLSGMLDHLDAATVPLAEGEETNSPAAKQQGRPLKNTVAIITAGAAAGASIGAATKKGTQAIVIGAIAGAAAGLIYDRMTAGKKNPPESGAEGAAPPAATNEAKPTGPSTQPIPVA